MSTISVKETHLRDLLEDWALVKAIEESESTETVSKAQVLQALEADEA